MVDYDNLNLISSANINFSTSKYSLAVNAQEFSGATVGFAGNMQHFDSYASGTEHKLNLYGENRAEVEARLSFSENLTAFGSLIKLNDMISSCIGDIINSKQLEIELELTFNVKGSDHLISFKDTFKLINWELVLEIDDVQRILATMVQFEGISVVDTGTVLGNARVGLTCCAEKATLRLIPERGNLLNLLKGRI